MSRSNPQKPLNGKHGRARRATWQWAVDLCSGPHAILAIAAIAFLESALLPIPIDLVLAPVVVARRREIWKIALSGAIGSVIGAVFGYLVGAWAFDTLGQQLVSASGMQEAFDATRARMATEGWAVVAIAGSTPIPFNLATLVAGATGMTFAIFLATVTLVRTLRFGLIVASIWLAKSGFLRLGAASNYWIASAVALLAAIAVFGAAIVFGQGGNF